MMYSPKIKEELIPRIYRLAKKKNMKMTVWVNRVLEKGLDEEEKDGSETPQAK